MDWIDNQAYWISILRPAASILALDQQRFVTGRSPQSSHSSQNPFPPGQAWRLWFIWDFLWMSCCSTGTRTECLGLQKTWSTSGCYFWKSGKIINMPNLQQRISSNWRETPSRWGRSMLCFWFCWKPWTLWSFVTICNEMGTQSGKMVFTLLGAASQCPSRCNSVLFSECAKRSLLVFRLWSLCIDPCMTRHIRYLKYQIWEWFTISGI